MSLVADYGDSSSSEDENESTSLDTSSSPAEAEHTKLPDILKLPTPDFIDSSTSKTSVFTNPFKQAEDEKQAILEKHVKMVDTQDNIRTINGKKVCWNYRKEKC
ncbi:hypothetical protein RN001_012629 [Aquatica leii]|uniref:Uncharacterized protein n=1 Tax=Aquatica leii TaxID=1421715 RepID=A0AAN7P457_9COLE|nr:hypothetical protein RN001_012629 [Aquatica leii]